MISCGMPMQPHRKIFHRSLYISYMYEWKLGKVKMAAKVLYRRQTGSLRYHEYSNFWQGSQVVYFEHSWITCEFQKFSYFKTGNLSLLPIPAPQVLQQLRPNRCTWCSPVSLTHHRDDIDCMSRLGSDPSCEHSAYWDYGLCKYIRPVCIVICFNSVVSLIY